MRLVYFSHSVLSCWNHGNAHFLRGVLSELLARGHQVHSFEPRESWSRSNLLQESGVAGTIDWSHPELIPYAKFLQHDVEAMLDGANVVLVHEWNDPVLVRAIGQCRLRGGRFLLLFHDTHHRAVTDPDAIGQMDLSGYDGVLAFGATLAQVYQRAGWGARCFIWHEAADTRRFHPPIADVPREGMVWIGNWGDEERSEELGTFLLGPAQAAGLPLNIYGVRYPEEARATIVQYGAFYRGWLANAQVPEVFGRHLMTVHVPRRAYSSLLLGIPTIRVFEALACGIPLLCAPWSDTEGLFRPDMDYLQAATPFEMQAHMIAVREDRDLRRSLIANGLETIMRRHTCAHRVDELLHIVSQLGVHLGADA